MNHVYSVSGMTCGHCEKTVLTAIRRLDPKAEVKIDRNLNRVEVKTEQPAHAVAAAIREEGYAVTD